MRITECGKYRLLRDYQTTNSIGIATLVKGSIIEIAQIDLTYNKVIGEPLLDWEYNDLPVERVGGTLVGVAGSFNSVWFAPSVHECI